jgi:hypothetical protein
MATPLSNTSCTGGRERHPRRWGVIGGTRSWLGGSTPPYLGAGQPEADSDSSLGSGTPAYLAAPPPTNVTQDVATAPQPKSVAIVVPRT